MGHWQMVSDIQKDLGIDLDSTGRELDEDLYSECTVEPLPEAAYLGPCKLGNIFDQSVRIWRRHMFAFMLTVLLPVTIFALGSFPLDLLFGDVQEGPIYWVTTAIRLCLFCWSVVCMQKAQLDIIDFDRCSPAHWFVHPRQGVSAALGFQLIFLVLFLPLLIAWFPFLDTEPEGELATTYFVGAVLWLFVVWWVIFRMHSFWCTFADLRVNALSGIRHAWAGSRGHVWRLFWADISLGFACCVISILTLCLAAPFLVAWVFCFEAVFYRTMHPRVD